MVQAGAYKQSEVNTADNVRIVSLLYDGAINFLNISKKRMEQGDIAGKGLYLGKVTAIIGELAAALDMERGGDISKNLDRLYSFITLRLIDISVRNDKKGYDDVAKVINELRSGWKEMEMNYRKSNAQAAQRVTPATAATPTSPAQRPALSGSIRV